MYRARPAAVVMLVMVLAACGNDTQPGDTVDDSGAPAIAGPTEKTTDPDPDEPIDPGDGLGENGDAPSPPSDPPKEDVMPDPEGPVGEAIADVAARTGAEPGDIEVVTHQQVTWRDGSMGCPQPGMMYTQALVEGYRIVLRVNGSEVAYHGARGKAPSRCDNPDPNGAVDGT